MTRLIEETVKLVRYVLQPAILQQLMESGHDPQVGRCLSAQSACSVRPAVCLGSSGYIICNSGVDPRDSRNHSGARSHKNYKQD